MKAPVDNPMIPRPFRARAVRRETHDVVTLELEPPDAGGFRFSPGQFNMLYVFGVGEIPISISGDPGKPAVLTHTTRAVGAVSRGICAIKKGGTVGVRGPFGNPWPVAEGKGKDIVIVAGGVGLAPIRPAILHILSHRKDYAGVSILYGARNPEEILFMKEIERWRSRLDLHVAVSVDTAGRDWRGRVGVVTKLLARATFDPQNTLALICGPEIMMRFTIQELESKGLADPSIYVTMERNMKCALGFCGHCQFGPHFICKDGPVFRYDRIRPIFLRREI